MQHKSWEVFKEFRTTQRYELHGVPDNERPSKRAVVIASTFFMMSFSALLLAMFAADMTPQYATALAIFTDALVLFFGACPRFSLAQGFDRLSDAMVNAGKLGRND